ncbi:VanZ family protein [Ferriphaselus sp. R-1]|uniref:VanZ family protein n=1 Tax=Ferriphaselus sp. R-1 TaxID=1485544 RepID=UPI00054E46B9|nr:VanZ family protein [Ferriphaselus sp. R-1]
MTAIRKAWLVLGWLWVAVVFYLSLTPHPPEPVQFWNVDKLEHALAYALLMLWFCQLAYSRVRLGLAFVAMGVGIEFLQGMTGYRYFEYADMLANSTGVLLGWGLAGTAAGRILLKIEAGAVQPER